MGPYREFWTKETATAETNRAYAETLSHLKPDSEAYISCRNVMALANIPLINLVVYSLKIRVPKEDLFQEAMLKQLSFIKHYNPQKGAYSTYVANSLRKQLLKYYSKDSKNGDKQFSLNTPLADEQTFLDIIPARAQSPPEEVARKELTTVVLTAVETLPRKERGILKSHYGIDQPCLTLRQLGKRYKLSYERIRQLECKAIERIKGRTVVAKLLGSFYESG